MKNWIKRNWFEIIYTILVLSFMAEVFFGGRIYKFIFE